MSRKYKVLDKQRFDYGNFSIVPIRDFDKYSIMKWRNDQIYHLRQKKKLSKQDQDKYFKNVIDKLFNNLKTKQILFSFLHNNLCVGYGGLVHINWEDRNAEVSFIMNTSHEKKQFENYWKVFLKLLDEVAFSELELFKIYIYAFDLRSHLYPVLEKASYKFEAKLKNHCLYNKDKYVDVLIYSKFDDKN